MADKVQVQYDQLKNIKAQIINQSVVILQTRNQINNQVATLQNGMWIGDSANAFYSEMAGTVFPALDRLKDALDRFATEIDHIQQTIAAAEQNAASRFNAS